MRTFLSEPAAGLVLVLDATGSASLTEIATATGKSLSTVQRAVEGLVRSNVVRRTGPRGRLVLAPDAPREAIREVARWSLGEKRATEVAIAAAYLQSGGRSLPATIRQTSVRRSLPVAVGRIVDSFQPDRVVLFGSQARGDADAQSDVDLLVVFHDEGDRRERQVAIRRLLADMPFAKDVLVTSEERYQHPLPGTAIKSAVAEGVTLYER
jgi:predicted nucleotidyltransferase